MTEANLETLAKLYDSLAVGDFATVLGLLPDDVRAHLPGNSPVAGEYYGKEAVAGYMGKLGELSGGTLRFQPHDVLASEGHGVGLVKDLAERGEKTLASTTCTSGTPAAASSLNLGLPGRPARVGRLLVLIQGAT